MTTPPPDLDRFLADLRGRRQRLLRLVSPETEPPEARPAGAEEAAALVAELQELGEQLIVADEELRVQQEELVSARRRIAAMEAESRAMLGSSTAVLVLTDESGVVLQATRAATDLLGQPAGRTPRPIPTWFDLPDRGRVRQLVSGRHLGLPQELQGAALRRSDGTTVLVDVQVSAIQGAARDPMTLRWQLNRASAGEPAMPTTQLPLAPGPGLAVELTEMTTRLAARTTLPETLLAVTQEAVRMVPGAQHAAVLGTDGDGASQTLAASGTAIDIPVGDELSVPLVLPGYADAALRLRAGRPGAFGAEARWIAGMLAVHFRVATARALHKENLEQAIRTRQQIGEAVGVLVERRRLTPEAAFDVLVARSKATNLKLREVARIVVETGQDPSEINRP